MTDMTSKLKDKSYLDKTSFQIIVQINHQKENYRWKSNQEINWIDRKHNIHPCSSVRPHPLDCEYITNSWTEIGKGGP